MIQGRVFQQEACDRYDPLGRKYAEEILRDTSKLEFIKENDESKHIEYYDLLYKDGDREIKIEAEIKNKKWFDINNKLYPFGFDTIDMCARKQKNKADYFLIISSEGNLACRISRKQMLDAKPFQKLCRKKYWDWFLRFHCSDCVWLKKENDKWEFIK